MARFQTRDLFRWSPFSGVILKVIFQGGNACSPWLRSNHNLENNKKKIIKDIHPPMRAAYSNLCRFKL